MASAALLTIAFASRAALDAWLAKHHATSEGVWLKLAKKSARVPSVSYAEAVAVALCWGWIDGQKQALDDDWWLQKLTPRSARSPWSKINCDKATALIADGKMRAAGLAEVERAKRDGRWDAAYDSPSNSKVPDDLRAALADNARAAAFFATIDATNRYAILWRIQTAKKPETRARRVAELVALLARGELLHPPRRAPRTGAGRANRSR
ncbi:MAG: YdeI family protein [Gemmatimonadales bacterium]